MTVSEGLPYALENSTAINRNVPRDDRLPISVGSAPNMKKLSVTYIRSAKWQIVSESSKQDRCFVEIQRTKIGQPSDFWRHLPLQFVPWQIHVLFFKRAGFIRCYTHKHILRFPGESTASFVTYSDLSSFLSRKVSLQSIHSHSRWKILNGVSVTVERDLNQQLERTKSG